MVIVISAVNFTNGGPLTILKSAVSGARDYFDKSVRIIVLVNNANLIETSGVELIEFPQCKNSWFIRAYYEYYGFKKYFKGTNVDIWLSLHDITPNVEAKHQIVYCHNPAPFYKANFRDFLLEPVFYLYCKLYIYIYKFKLEDNAIITVQQNWIADEFKKFSKNPHILVAHPESTLPNRSHDKIKDQSSKKNTGKYIQLLYPALPRVFKNFEVLIEASSILNQRGFDNIRFIFTINGRENIYARWVKLLSKNNNSIQLVGYKTKQELENLYRECDAVVFPSKLETWGLPISESKELNKKIIVSNSIYSKETVGNYPNAVFFDPDSAANLADIIISFIVNQQSPGSLDSVYSLNPISGWKMYWDSVTDILNNNI